MKTVIVILGTYEFTDDVFFGVFETLDDAKSYFEKDRKIQLGGSEVVSAYECSVGAVDSCRALRRLCWADTDGYHRFQTALQWKEGTPP